MIKSKILVSIASVALTATAIPIGILLSNKEYPPESIVWPGQLIPHLTSARNIRNKHRQVDCLTKHYKERIIWNSANYTDTEFKEINSFDANSNSCLLVEYYKQEYEVGKWWGEFKLIWSVKDETNNQGLLTVTNARTYDKNLLGNSAAYAIKKSSSGDAWAVAYHKEIQESKKDNSALKRLIPQATLTSSDSLINSTNYWGFNPTLGNICGKGDCMKVKGQIIKNSYSWEFTKNSENKDVHSWISNIGEWLRNIFDWEKIKSKIDDVKGKWESK